MVEGDFRRLLAVEDVSVLGLVFGELGPGFLLKCFCPEVCCWRSACAEVRVVLARRLQVCYLLCCLLPVGELLRLDAPPQQPRSLPHQSLEVSVINRQASNVNVSYLLEDPRANPPSSPA